MRTRVWLLALILLTTSTASNAADQRCDSRWSREVVDALLNRDLTLAQQRIDAWQAQTPGHTALPLHRALVEVARADYSAETDTTKYNQPLAELDKVSEILVKQLEDNPDDYLLRLNLATARAVSGRLLMEQGRWLKAYNHGHEARGVMQQLLDEDTTRYDTYLILGLFEYFSGSLPNVLRWLSHLIDFSGDAGRGIEYLELAVTKAEVAAPQAAEALLTEVQHTPQQACRYRSLARTMRQRYPDNPRYVWAVSQLERQCRTLPFAERPAAADFQLAAAHCP